MSELFFQHSSLQFEQYLHSKKYSQIILLADANTNGFCLPVLKREISLFKNCFSIVIPQGEVNKRIEVIELIWNELVNCNADRNSLLVNVGGGMLSDMGGFAAATYKRGIDFVNIPTTLLAMVDASIGGKVGFDFKGIKNAIGLFKHPIAIFIHNKFLHSLSERNLRSGFAEMIKHALISSQENWTACLTYEMSNFVEISNIEKSVAIKQNLVAQDEFDKNERQQLNFGHSIGHAIESASLESKHALLHGEAIMLGMQIEIALSQAIFGLDSQVIEQYNHLLNNLFPNLKNIYSFEKIKPYLEHDKKNEHGFRMSLLKAVGECNIKTLVPLSLIEFTYNSYVS